MKSLFGIYILFALMFAACSAPQRIAPDKVRVHLGAEPATLNPITGTDAYTSEINSYLFESLLDRDRDSLEFIPKVAHHWEISDDKKTYTFYMRKDVLWHDGKPLTADDVVFSFETIMDPKTNAPHMKVYYQDIESVKKLDDYTVQFRYKEVYFMALSFCGGMPILPKHIVSQYKDFEGSPYSRHPIGNGPYKFKSWATNSKIILERNEQYWDKKPEIRVIEFKIIPDPSIGLQVLKKGELDVFTLSSIQWAKQTSSEKFTKNFTKLAYASPGYSYIGWNNSHPIFSDTKVRVAMTHLINRKKINEKLDFGLGLIVTGPFFPFSKQYNKDVLPEPYDVKKAKAILKEAGWEDHDHNGWLDKDGKTFKFDFLFPSASKASERIATIMKEELKNVGIQMTITRMEWAAFLDRLNQRKFDATMLGWSTGFESDPYQVWDMSTLDKPNSSNFISYKSERASQIIRKARVEFDEDKRNQMYGQFHKLLSDEQPYTFMFNKPSLVVVSRRFDGVKIHKAGLNLLEWKVKH